MRTGVFFGCRAAIPHLERTKGSIVNTASVSGTGGDWAMSPYNAAKGAVVNLTRALAMDLGKKGIRVNSVCPSLTRTAHDRRHDGRQGLAGEIPSGSRWGGSACLPKSRRSSPLSRAMMPAS